MYRREFILGSVLVLISLCLNLNAGPVGADRDGDYGGLARSAVADRDGDYGGYDWAGSNDIAYKNPYWMAGIPNDRRISELSIPGTHETMSIHPNDAWALFPWNYWLPVTQQMYLENQLPSGIRALDIRLQRDGDNLKVWHGVVNQHADFNDVLRKVVQFLEEPPIPTETVLMRITETSSCTFCDTSRTFLELIDEYLTDWDYVGCEGDNCSYGNWVWQPTSINPTLGEVRGKIVILDDFSDSGVKLDSGPAVDAGLYTSLAM